MRVLLAKMWQRTRPSFDMSLQGKQIVVDYANVASVQLRYCMNVVVVVVNQLIQYYRHYGLGVALLHTTVLCR